MGIYDRVVIQEILKEIAQTQQGDLNTKRQFKGAHSFRIARPAPMVIRARCEITQSP